MKDFVRGKAQRNAPQQAPVLEPGIVLGLLLLLRKVAAAGKAPFVCVSALAALAEELFYAQGLILLVWDLYAGTGPVCRANEELKTRTFRAGT